MSVTKLQFDDDFSAPAFQISFSDLDWDTHSLPSSYGYYKISEDYEIQKKEMRGVPMRNTHSHDMKTLPWAKFTYTGSVEAESHNKSKPITIELEFEDGDLIEIKQKL